MKFNKKKVRLPKPVFIGANVHCYIWIPNPEETTRN